VPVEVAEVRYPWRVERFELRQDSAGAGKYRGGLGVIRDYRITKHKAGLTVTTDRVKYTPPWGLFGGGPGKTNITVVLRKDGTQEQWRKISNLPLDEDEVVSFQTGGGGGYGPPLERDLQAVLDDVIDGYISLKCARQDYGVVINEKDMTVDSQATEKLRKSMDGN
jgi:N-methylhydantoinase B